jgi:hypothetical protein
MVGTPRAHELLVNDQVFGRETDLDRQHEFEPPVRIGLSVFTPGRRAGTD